jgi:hypothetical protein
MIKDRVGMLKISSAALNAFSLPGMHPRFFLVWLIMLIYFFPGTLSTAGGRLGLCRMMKRQHSY